jgi:hypothetical protein
MADLGQYPHEDAQRGATPDHHGDHRCIHR